MSGSSKQRVRITYTSPGAQPPVFVAGAFTDPPWQPCEMDKAPGSTVDQQGRPDNTFFKDFHIAEGSWQYKFRLGSGDWWACDESAKIVTDGAGNRNNLLVVAPHHVEHQCLEKRLHARPFHRSDESSHETAWEVVGASVHSSERSHQKHSLHTKRHLNRHLSRDGSEKVVREGQHNETSADTMPDGVAETRRSPLVYPKVSREDSIEEVAEEHNTPTPEDALTHPEAGAENPQLLVSEPKDDVDFNVEAAIPFVVTDTEAQGDRKMSSADIEKVKLLMSLTSPNGESPTIMAVQDGEIVEIDPAEPQYSPSWASSGLELNMHSHAPLLSHECLTCGPEANISDPGISAQQSRKQSNSSEDRDGSEDPPTPDDFDSPLLERFPSGVKDILQRIATLQKEIPPDEAIVSRDDYFLGSPLFMTRDAPTFPHEMPPIGSPAALRRKASSVESFSFHGDMDGSPDIRSHGEGPHDSYLLPPSSVPLNYIREDSSLSSSRSFTDNEEEPLLQAASKPARTSTSPREAATHSSSQAQDPSLESEGVRLRNAKTADVISSTEDASAAPDVAKTSWWQDVVNWFSALLERFFGVGRTE